MLIDSLFKILSGAGSIAHAATKNVALNAQGLIEDQALKGRYVSREEFESLKTMVTNLNSKLEEYSKKTP